MASFFFTQGESAQVNTQDNSREPNHLRLASALVQQTQGRLRRHTSQKAVGEHPPTPSRRQEATPPALFSRQARTWKTPLVHLWHWLWDADSLPPAPASITGLAKAKSEFNIALWDLQSLHANEVRDMVNHARSLRELWHLRAQVFKAISMHRGQIEAQSRLDTLDAHFPVKSSRRHDEARLGRSSTW